MTRDPDCIPPVPTEEGGELKPCPFCGKVPDLFQDDQQPDPAQRAWRVECGNVDECSVLPCFVVDGEGREVRGAIIAAWNARPSPISHEDRPLELAAADNNHKALVEALEKAREQFRFYAQQHIAKTPPDYAKGQTNLDMVTMCDAALAAAQPSQQAASAAATKEASDQSRQEGK